MTVHHSGTIFTASVSPEGTWRNLMPLIYYQLLVLIYLQSGLMEKQILSRSLRGILLRLLVYLSLSVLQKTIPEQRTLTKS